MGWSSEPLDPSALHQLTVKPSGLAHVSAVSLRKGATILASPTLRCLVRRGRAAIATRAVGWAPEVHP